MITVVRVPKVSANDEIMRLVHVFATEGELVAEGAMLAEVEGEKAVVEVNAPVAGYFYPCPLDSDEVAVGRPLGLISDKAIGLEAALAAQEKDVLQPAAARPGSNRVSAKAAALMSANGLSPDDFPSDALITEALVVDLLRSRGGTDKAPAPSGLAAPVADGNGRVLLCGAGAGAAQVLAILGSEDGTVVLGILDDDPAKAGTTLHGLTVVGTCDEMAAVAAEVNAEAVICTTPTSIAFRRKVTELAKDAGLLLANAIHPTARFDDGVLIGGGNVFGAFCFIGAETRIGDGGFFSSRTTFEHHNHVGSFVTTGPNVATSGLVTIGTGVRFGTGIVVEPSLHIEDGAVLASGSVVTSDIKAGTVLKARQRRVAAD